MPIDYVLRSKPLSSHNMLPLVWAKLRYIGTYRDTLDAIDQHGCVPVPQGPGLGVEIDWEWVAHNRSSLQTY
jgi:L-alanine-DL-glutamate epimerase-like enolase superfamily enzyme